MDKIQAESPSQKRRVSRFPTIKKFTKLSKKRICINLTDCKYEVLRKVCKKILNWQVIQDDDCNMNFDIMWNDAAMNQDLLGRLKPYQKLNHFPGIFTIARKNLLAYHLNRMQKQFPEEYNFYPRTFSLPTDRRLLYEIFDQKKINKNQIEDKKGNKEENTKISENKFTLQSIENIDLNIEKQITETKQKKIKKQKTILILKPEASSQGKGIFLVRKIEEIPQNLNLIAQEYILNPFLIDGLKFDLRVYALIVSVTPLTIYLYKEGIGRFATELYTIPNSQNIKDMCVHLTNYAINKNSNKFQFDPTGAKPDSGHKRSMTSVLNTIYQMNGVKPGDLMSKIGEIIIKTMCSIQPILKHIYVSSQPDDFTASMCFEVLGFDIILNDKLEPQLLEVNHAPSFNIDTPFDDQLKTGLMVDVFNILDLTVERRNEIIEREKLKRQDRMVSGVRTKISNEEKDSFKIDYLSALEEKVKDKNGKFYKIFPKKQKEEMVKYNEFMSWADEAQMDKTGVSQNQINSKLAKDKQLNSLQLESFQKQQNQKVQKKNYPSIENYGENNNDKRNSKINSSIQNTVLPKESNLKQKQFQVTKQLDQNHLKRKTRISKQISNEKYNQLTLRKSLRKTNHFDEKKEKIIQQKQNLETLKPNVINMNFGGYQFNLFKIY